MEEKQREYARLLAAVGLNLQPGQTLILSSPVECAPFARLCASAAYDLGAGEVVMNWSDDFMTREKFLRARDEAFRTPRAWRKAFFTEYAEQGAAYLALAAEDPETLLGVPPERLIAAQRTSSAERETFDRLQMANGFPWCVAGAPVTAWAKKVFPALEEHDAVDALWEAIFATVRVTGDGRAEARAAPVAKDGKCPTVVFEIDSARAERYASGTWCVYLLDTRRYAEDGAVSLAGVSSDGAAKSVNAVGKIAGVSVKVSDVAHAPETAVASKAVSAATASALPKDVPQPKIKGIRVEGGFVYVTVANTVPYLQYNLDAGATPAQLDEARAANNPVNGQADGDIILVSPVKVGGSFFRVNRN